MHEAFLTGSQVYGTPRPDSDVDLAVFMPEPDFSKFGGMFWNSKSRCGADGQDYPDTTACFRFGDLNLLLFKCAVEFSGWKKATAELIKRKPVTRDEAADAIEEAVVAAVDAIVEVADANGSK